MTSRRAPVFFFLIAAGKYKFNWMFDLIAENGDSMTGEAISLWFTTAPHPQGLAQQLVYIMSERIDG